MPGTLGQAPGGLADVDVLPWNNLQALQMLLTEKGNDIAGVIMEPVMCNTCVIPPKPGYLAEVRRLCDDHGIVLIFDEVITGFRIALGGAQERFGVYPDLAIFAKAMGGGFPISCLAGKHEIMALFEQGVVHGGTCNASLPTIAAALSTIHELTKDGAKALKRALTMGERLMTGLQEAAARHKIQLLIQGYGTVFNTAFTHRGCIEDYRSARDIDLSRLRSFIDGMRKNGIRPQSRGNWYVSAAHGEDEIGLTVKAADAVFATIA
jgi:glutamate-1-semialdehyde 2,1-aminomutase